MSIIGLGTYSRSDYFSASFQKNRNAEALDSDAVFAGMLTPDRGEANEMPDGKCDTLSTPYVRCITASIKAEQVMASRAGNGEMIYSYRAMEQSFQIYIKSDGENRTYSVSGYDKDGKPFEKEFDPYDVDPENADFPEFSALCMYIQQTDDTADLLANDFFKTGDILQKRNYLGMLGDFLNDGIFGKAQSMMDSAMKLMDRLNGIVKMKSGIESAIEPFRMQLLTLDLWAYEEDEAEDNEIADFLKIFKESNKITAKELKDPDDWREMSDDEWDKMLEDIDKYIDAFKERIRELVKCQQEAAQKAAAEASPEMRSAAASEAALEVASNGFFGGTNAESETDTDTESDADTGVDSSDEEAGIDHEKNWTRRLKTDDQTILREAKAAQDLEKMASSRIEELKNEDSSVVYRKSRFNYFDDEEDRLRNIV